MSLFGYITFLKYVPMTLIILYTFAFLIRMRASRACICVGPLGMVKTSATQYIVQKVTNVTSKDKKVSNAYNSFPMLHSPPVVKAETFSRKREKGSISDTYHLFIFSNCLILIKIVNPEPI